MALRLNGQSTGYTELNAPDNGDQVVLTMPGNDGDSGQYLQTNGSGVLSWATVATPTTASWTTVNTAASSSSGTIEFTGLPGDEIDQLIFSYNNLNSTDNSDYRLTIGTSSGYASSGYQANSGYLASSTNVSRYTTDWSIRGSAGAGNGEAQFLLTKHIGNTWQITGMMLDDASDIMYFLQGSCPLSGALDRIRVQLGTGNFDAQGSATVQYLRTP